MRPLGDLQNQPIDPSLPFTDQSSHFFFPQRLEAEGNNTEGKIVWRPMSLQQRISYHQVTQQFADYRVWSNSPEHEYEDEQRLPFKLSFVSTRTVRIRLALRPIGLDGGESLMVEHVPYDDSWETKRSSEEILCRGAWGTLEVKLDPWQIQLFDSAGRLLTRTNHLDTTASVLNTNPMPFCAARNSTDLHRFMAASFLLSPGERLYGAGESFTRLDKRGQKLHLWTLDAYSSLTSRMYKPIPFVLSSRGYGLFVHSSAAMTFDLGHTHGSGALFFVGDDVLDLFFFLGDPRSVLTEYTALTGRPAPPPRWSFGLWMGRESYKTQTEVLEVGHRLRAQRIPCDVLHIDTHWLEIPMRCDFRFSESRFSDPRAMAAQLRRMNLRLSLWQFPYFHPADPLHQELISKGFVIRNVGGRPPVDDAILDLTNEGPSSGTSRSFPCTYRLDAGSTINQERNTKAAPQRRWCLDGFRSSCWCERGPLSHTPVPRCP
jgi:alpha-D-xyloside xylohydrolase